MLRRASPGFNRVYGSLVYALTPKNGFSRSATSAAAAQPSNAKINRFRELLESANPLEVYAAIKEASAGGKKIPEVAMKRLYEAIESSPSPLEMHLFASLVTVEQLGTNQFTTNAERLIRLLIAQRDWEPCVAFIRELEFVNQGQVHLSYDTLEALILSAKWHGDLEIALQVAKVLHSTYQYMSSRTWGLVLQLALDVRDYHGLKWLHKSALVPGLLVPDDSSYLRIASVAAEHGDLALCEWVSLRMRRRQRALQVESEADTMKLYLYLIEAAARASLVNPSPTAPGFYVVTRYLARLGPLAGQVSVKGLPQTVEAISEQSKNQNAMMNVFEALCADPSACNQTKVIFFNLLLAAKLKTGGSLAEESRLAREAGVEFSEDTILLLLELAYKRKEENGDLEAIAAQLPTPRVLKRAKALAALKSGARRS